MKQANEGETQKQCNYCDPGDQGCKWSRPRHSRWPNMQNQMSGSYVCHCSLAMPAIMSSSLLWRSDIQNKNILTVRSTQEIPGFKTWSEKLFCEKNERPDSQSAGSLLSFSLQPTSNLTLETTFKETDLQLDKTTFKATVMLNCNYDENITHDCRLHWVSKFQSQD